MGTWNDARVEADVLAELNDLQAVLQIISQMSKDTAVRILHYCYHYVNKQGTLPPSMDESKDVIAELLKSKGGWK